MKLLKTSPAFLVLLLFACGPVKETQPVNAATTAAQSSFAVPARDGPTDEFSAMGLIPFKDKQLAPDFTLMDLEGKSLRLSSLRGKVVLLNFWATWCPPCRAEMPSLEKLYQTFSNREDFVLLAVDSQEEKNTVRDFIQKNNYHFKILLDGDGKVDYLYSINAIPTTYLIDREGRVMAGKTGAHDWSILAVTDGLKKLLGS